MEVIRLIYLEVYWIFLNPPCRWLLSRGVRTIPHLHQEASMKTTICLAAVLGASLALSAQTPQKDQTRTQDRTRTQAQARDQAQTRDQSRSRDQLRKRDGSCGQTPGAGQRSGRMTGRGGRGR